MRGDFAWRLQISSRRSAVRSSSRAPDAVTPVCSEPIPPGSALGEEDEAASASTNAADATLDKDASTPPMLAMRPSSMGAVKAGSSSRADTRRGSVSRDATPVSSTVSVGSAAWRAGAPGMRAGSEGDASSFLRCEMAASLTRAILSTACLSRAPTVTTARSASCACACGTPVQLPSNMSSNMVSTSMHASRTQLPTSPLLSMV
mmetsp:Transcript_33101/g.73170  ORF Transcript_33101/g.73170 Transcript_33101/m.73170 type:complete len:204 (+) Transcript_33101:961-1572(+)